MFRRQYQSPFRNRSGAPGGGITSLTVEAVDGETSCYGKQAKDLQSDIVISDDTITGTLNYVTGYEQFNPSDKSEQSGNYIALSLTSDEDAEIKTQLIGGNKGEIIIDDGFCVYRITDHESQKIKVSVTKGEDVVTKTYDLSGLTCKESQKAVKIQNGEILWSDRIWYNG